MQRCLQIRLPLARARLQAAARITYCPQHFAEASPPAHNSRRQFGTAEQNANRDALSDLSSTLPSTKGGRKRRGKRTASVEAADTWSWTEEETASQNAKAISTPSKGLVTTVDYHDAQDLDKTQADELANEDLITVDSAQVNQAFDGSPGDRNSFSDSYRATPRLIRRTGTPVVDWKTVHAKLKRLSGEQSSKGNNILLSEAMKTHARTLAESFMNPSIMRHRWLQAFLWIVSEQRDKTLEFLLKTCQLVEDMPDLCVSQAVCLMAEDIDKLGHHEIAHAKCVKLLDQLAKLLVLQPNRSVSVPARVLKTLLEHLYVDDIQRLYALVQGGRLTLNWSGHCIWARYQADYNNPEQAVDLFVEAVKQVDPQEPFLLRTLHYLARKLVQHADNHLQCLRLCSVYVQHGGRFRTAFGSAFVNSVARNGRGATATKMYSTIFSQSVSPSAAATMGMLEAYKQNPEQSMSLDDIIADAFLYDTMSQRSSVANSILHFEMIRSIETDVSTAWPRICGLFDQLYNSDAHELLGLPAAGGSQAGYKQYRSISKQEPDHWPITTLLQAFARLSDAGQFPKIDPVDVYKAWRLLAQRGIEPYTKIATTDFVYNAFLHLFVKEKHTLINATDVMKDMQTPLTISGATIGCTPTPRSWNLFLMGFEHHEKPELANQVLEHMKANNIPTNKYTWDILLGQASRTGDVERALDILDRAGEDDVELDSHLTDHLRLFKGDKTALRDRLRRKLDFSSELKHGMVSRLETDGERAGGGEKEQEHRSWTV